MEVEEVEELQQVVEVQLVSHLVSETSSRKRQFQGFPQEAFAGVQRRPFLWSISFSNS